MLKRVMGSFTVSKGAFLLSMIRIARSDEFEYWEKGPLHAYHRKFWIKLKELNSEASTHE